jgi:hypothetical protein
MPCTRGASPSQPILRFQWKGERSLRKTRFWAAVAVAALLLLGIAGWANTNANTNANTKNLEALGPRINPFQIMLNAKNLPTQELDEGLYGTLR